MTLVLAVRLNVGYRRHCESLNMGVYCYCLDALKYVRHPPIEYDTAEKGDLHPSGVTA